MKPPMKPLDYSPIQWGQCEDIIVRDNDGDVIYNGPKYLRCSRQQCNIIVTQAMVRSGGCWCGNRRLIPAIRLTAAERMQVKSGYFPLSAWEVELIQPILPLNKDMGWGRAEFEEQYSD